MFGLEKWKPVEEYPEYEVSSYGRVRSLKYGKIRMIRPGVGRSGYSNVVLYKDKKKNNRGVHILVAYAFLGERPRGFDINHKSGIKTDNRVENLEYCSRTENMLHAYNLGLNPRNKRVLQLTKDGQAVKIFNSMRGAEVFGFDHGLIGKCCAGELKTHGGFKWKYA